MFIDRFNVQPHNAHYEGAYSEAGINWRRVCALDKARNMHALLGNRSVTSVLEVGCGTGALLAAVAKRGIGSQHVGIDMADPHEHLDGNAQDLRIMKFDGSVLPFEDKSFDLVFASHVIEHVPNPRGLISEMKRVSKGLIYLEVPCELHCRTTKASLQLTLAIGHINAYTPESFVLLVQTSELGVLDAEVFDHSLFQ